MLAGECYRKFEPIKYQRLLDPKANQTNLMQSQPIDAMMRS